MALFVFSSSNTYAQSPCPDGNCTSGDLTITKVELVREDGSAMPNSCPPNSSSVPVRLKVTFDVTSNTRYGFLIVGDVYLNGVKSDKIWQCYAQTFAQGPHTLVVAKTFDWPCGSTIELRDVFTAWDNSNTLTTFCNYLNNSTGALTGCSTIAPKCKYYGASESFVVAAPLIANFTTSGTCPGNTLYQPITFSSPVTGEGASSGGNKPYSYSWEVEDAVTSAVLATSNLSSFTYTPVSGNDLLVKLTVTDASDPTVSDDVTKTISVETCCTPPAVSSHPASVTKCAGQTATFSISSTGGSPSPTIQWQVKPAGGDWANIASGSPYSNVNSATLALSPIPSSFNNYQFRAVLQSGLCEKVYSNEATLTLSAPTVGGTVSAAQTVCNGSAPANSLSLSGQVGNVVRWERSTDGFGNNVATISNTTTTLTGAAIGALSQDTWFRAVVKSGECGAEASAAVKITVQQPISNNSIAANQTICSNTAPATLTGNVPSGGDGSYTYQWQWRTTGGWSNIPDANGQNLSPAPIVQTTQFQRLATSGTACPSGASNVVTISVSEESRVYSLEGSNFCATAPATGTITLGGSYPGVSYQLYKVGSATGEQDPKVGNGDLLSWTGLTAGQYYVKGTGVAPTNCPSLTGIATVHEFDCSVFYTLTQGYYGNKNGKSCIGKTPIETIQYLLGNQSLIIGTTKYVTVPATIDGARRVNDVLPGGGTPTGLPAGAACDITDKKCFKSPEYLTEKQQRINNNLLSQTLTLSLNARWKEGELLLFPIRSGYLTTQAMTGCQDGAVVVDVCGSNTVSSILMNEKVVQYLGNGATVKELIDLANGALGGTVPAGVGNVPSYNDINDAVDAINKSFDEGRRFLDYYSEKQTCEMLFPPSLIAEPVVVTNKKAAVAEEAITVTALSVKAFPNPFGTTVRFDVQSDIAGNGVLELFNTMGQRVATVYRGQIVVGRQSFEANLSGRSSQALIYVFTIGDKKVTGKLFRFGGQ